MKEDFLKEQIPINLYNMCHKLFELNVEEIIFTEKQIRQVILALSIYFHFEKDKRALEVLLLLIRNKSIPLEAKIYIVWQLSRINFVNTEDIGIDIYNGYDFLVKEIKANGGLKQVHKFVAKDRDRKSVVFITSQFLGIKHSPTKLLLQMVKMLNDSIDEIEYIYIINSGEMPIKQTYDFLDGFSGNYIKHDDESIKAITKQLGIDRCKVKYVDNYTFEVSNTQIDEMARKIYNIKPRYVFSIGDKNILAEVCSSFTDVFTISLSANAKLCCTKYFVSTYEGLDVREHKLKNSQHLIEVPYSLDMFKDEQKDYYNRNQYGIGKEDFVICIVGNRLKEEITDDVLDICTQLLYRNNHVKIMFIGSYYKSYLDRNRFLGMEDRVYFMGKRKRLVATIQLANVYLNPKRNGGGYSCIAAMEAGIPVVSLNYGDVKFYIDAQFRYESYEKMEQAIQDMIDNPKLYDQKCKDTYTRHSYYRRNNWDKLIRYIDEYIYR